MASAVNYNLWLIIIGIALLGAATLPRVLSSFPVSTPMVLLIFGYVAVKLPFGPHPFDPLEHGTITEHLTELGVIISLTAAGLKIDRQLSFRGWNSTWRLLGITMILSVALTAFAGFWLGAFLPAAAVLLGAVIAPTDPVLATAVQVGEPGECSNHKFCENEVRFSLTSEAGLNDGLAFPFTNMAIAIALYGMHPGNWVIKWVLVDVFYKIGAAVIVGIVMGWILAWTITRIPAKTEFTKYVTGLCALAITFIIYGSTEIIEGYGFIATFVGAVTFRSYERNHEYHRVMHVMIEQSERMLSSLILLFLGGAVAAGILDSLTWPLVITSMIIIFLVRPISGIAALIGCKKVNWRQQMIIGFYGIRGIGSLYYLSFALNQANFPQSRQLWASVTLIVIISIFIHGISASFVMSKME